MDPEKLSENRCQLASLARLKKRRRVGREFPCDWRPSTVTSPEDNQPFTEAGAWEFIAQMLEDEPAQEVTLLTLDRPAGKTALVMKRVLPAHSTSKSNTAADPAFWGAAFITAIIEAKP